MFTTVQGATDARLFCLQQWLILLIQTRTFHPVISSSVADSDKLTEGGCGAYGRMRFPKARVCQPKLASREN
jgi:hypothetical protein